jgi:CRP-like cAMP-binding protein
MSIPIDENSWIDLLPETVARDVRSAMIHKRYCKGETVYRQGDQSDALYLLQSGEVTIGNLSFSGKEYVVGLIKCGSCFGELGMIDGLPRANNAIASVDSEILALKKEDFWRLRELHREIADQLLLFVNHRLRLSYMTMQSSSLSGLPQQLAFRLHYLVKNHSVERPDGFEITLKLSQEDLGKTLGVSRQSINKAIKVLSDERLLIIKGGRLLVTDPEKLETFAAQDLL